MGIILIMQQHEKLSLIAHIAHTIRSLCLQLCFDSTLKEYLMPRQANLSLLMDNMTHILCCDNITKYLL